MALELPARRLKDVHLTRRAAENGLNSCFNETLHCLAQEPTTTVLRVAVLEGDKDVAYETCLISSLRPGYRVLHLRSLLGTRIECAVLFVRISLGVEPNNFGLSGEAVQKQLAGSEARIKQLNALIKNSIARQLAISLENQKLELGIAGAAARREAAATAANANAVAAAAVRVSSPSPNSSARNSSPPTHRDVLQAVGKVCTAATAEVTAKAVRRSSGTEASGRTEALALEVVDVSIERAASEAARGTAGETAGEIAGDPDACNVQRPRRPSMLQTAGVTRECSPRGGAGQIRPPCPAIGRIPSTTSFVEPSSSAASLVGR